MTAIVRPRTLRSAGEDPGGASIDTLPTRSFGSLGSLTLAPLEVAAARRLPPDGSMQVFLRRRPRAPSRLSATGGDRPGPIAPSAGDGSDQRALGFDEVLCLVMPVEAVERLCPAFGSVDLDALALRRPTSPLVEALLDSLWNDEASSGDAAFVESRLAVLLHELARLVRQAPAPARPVGGLAPWALNRVFAHLEASLAETVSLAELAALARLSPYHFSRAFKVSTGLPPHRWVQVRRVERAKALLAERDVSVLVVAAAVGYDNPGHFARIFRREAGMTPRDYRRSI